MILYEAKQWFLLKTENMEFSLFISPFYFDFIVGDVVVLLPDHDFIVFHFSGLVKVQIK